MKKRGAKLSQVDLSDRLNRVWKREGMVPGDIALYIRSRRSGKHRWHALHREARTPWALVEAVEELATNMGNGDALDVDENPFVDHAMESTVWMACPRYANTDAQRWREVVCVVGIQSMFVPSTYAVCDYHTTTVVGMPPWPLSQSVSVN